LVDIRSAPLLDAETNSTREAETAERNLTTMRDQQRLVRERIYDLQQELAQVCSNAKVASK
jgi:chaperonin cofactor prefoldin